MRLMPSVMSRKASSASVHFVTGFASVGSAFSRPNGADFQSHGRMMMMTHTLSQSSSAHATGSLRRSSERRRLPVAWADDDWDNVCVSGFMAFHGLLHLHGVTVIR